MFIIIVLRSSSDRPSGLLFFCARFISFHSHGSLLTVFVCFFILFNSCSSHARVFGRAHVHEFPVSCTHAEFYLIFYETTWSKWSKSRLSKTNYNYNYCRGTGTLASWSTIGQFSQFIQYEKLSASRGRVDDFSFFDGSKLFYYLLIEFCRTFFHLLCSAEVLYLLLLYSIRF